MKLYQVLYALTLTFFLAKAQAPTWPAFLKTCNSTLGFRNKKIKDSQFTASSMHKSKLFFFARAYWYPSYARLFNTGLRNGWIPEFNNKGQKNKNDNIWLQIDLLESTIITSMVIQGVQRYTKDTFVEEYSLEISKDGQHWQNVQLFNSRVRPSTHLSESTEHIDENTLVFRGNLDDETIQLNYMPRLVITRFIRVRPRVWHRHPAIRMELLGCDFSGIVPLPNGANTEFKMSSQMNIG